MLNVRVSKTRCAGCGAGVSELTECPSESLTVWLRCPCMLRVSRVYLVCVRHRSTNPSESFFIHCRIKKGENRG